MRRVSGWQVCLWMRKTKEGLRKRKRKIKKFQIMEKFPEGRRGAGDKAKALSFFVFEG